MADIRLVRGQRVRALRAACGLSQREVERASDGELDRTVVAQIEGGRNAVTSTATLFLLARALDVPAEPLAAYLDGAVSLRGILALRGMRARAEWWREVVAAAEAEPDG
jgi:transcriptional regulator with XRE-family HTH domain